MLFTKYFSTQALDEGFSPNDPPGKEIFYRTPDWSRYKDFKGHAKGELTSSQASRYDRHAAEIAKIMDGAKEVLSLGGGTGSLEKRLARYYPNTNFIVSDIYDRDPAPDVTYLKLDMTDSENLKHELNNIDTVLIVNALSPLCPNEVKIMFNVFKSSNVKNIIIYSAEDIRLLGYVIYFIKRLLFQKPAMWIGYLYSSKYISRIAENIGFSRVLFCRPKQHGILSPFWGSIYLIKLVRGVNNAGIDPGINKQSLIM